jgi:hypothetical protein
MFTVYNGKCLSRKAVHNWVEKFSEMTFEGHRLCPIRCGSGWGNTRKTSMLRISTHWQVYQCWWRICREINVYFRFEYDMFYVLYPFVNFPRIFTVWVTRRWCKVRSKVTVSSRQCPPYCRPYSPWIQPQPQPQPHPQPQPQLCLGKIYLRNVGLWFS